MEQQDYLDRYEQSLTGDMVQLLSRIGLLDGQLLASADLDEKWESIAEAYLPDGVREIAKYPTVSLGWMCYVGMALARFWDKDWERKQREENLYTLLRDVRGFDCMDEYIMEDVLQLTPEAQKQTEETVRTLSTMALTRIRREGVEPQSPMAFHIYVRSIHALYLVGIALELKRGGYHFGAV